MKWLTVMIFPVLAWGNLSAIKYLILNGSLEQAQRRLEALPQHKVQQRYLATLYVIKEQWIPAWKILSDPSLQSPRYYPRICPLKILTQIALGKTLSTADITACLSSRGPATKSDRDWLWTMARPESSSPIDFNQYRHDDQDTLQWLKLVISLGREREVFPALSTLSYATYQDPRALEIIGLIYYRLGQHNSALELLEGISLPNAHNIRGNMALKDKNYNEALQHFQLAIKQKPDSFNAIHRSLVLHWMRQEFALAEKLTQALSRLGNLPTGGEIFHATLLTELGQYPQAIEKLLLLSPTERELNSRPINELLAFNYLMTQQPGNALVAAYRSCLDSNKLHCYLLTQLSQWGQFAKLVHTAKAIPSPQGIDLEELTSRTLSQKNFEPAPLSGP